jgi:hypothetical protein
METKASQRLLKRYLRELRAAARNARPEPL